MNRQKNVEQNKFFRYKICSKLHYSHKTELKSISSSNFQRVFTLKIIQKETSEK